MSGPHLHPTTSFVRSSDEIDVAVHDFGGSGRLLVLCHATGFCGHVWQPMIASLIDHFHCVALDFRGQGYSELPAGTPPEVLAWRGMADDLTAVIEAYSPGEPVLAVGHSLGGSAMILAETTRPGLVEKGWTFEPILLPMAPAVSGEGAPEIAKAARNRRPGFGSRAEALERYGSRPPLGLLDPRALAAYVEHGMVETEDGSVLLRCTPDVEATIFEHHNAGVAEAVDRISIPFVMCVGGGADEEDKPAAWVHAAAARNPHLALVEFPDLTHFGPLEEPDRLAVDVCRFLLGETGGA